MGPVTVLVFNSLLLGVGLAMDAFSVSLANGLHEPGMSRGRMCLIAGTFGVFQALMPLTGWLCVRTIAQRFETFQRFIPWIALILLCYIGGSMLLEGIRHKEGDDPPPAATGSASSPVVSLWGLFVQGVATSIDALSVGFTISDHTFPMALSSALIIAAVTFVICMAGLRLGKRFGTKLAGRASLLGGAILIAIGLEIFFSSFLR